MHLQSHAGEKFHILHWILRISVVVIATIASPLRAEVVLNDLSLDNLDITSEIVYLQTEKSAYIKDAEIADAAAHVLERGDEFRELPEKLDIGSEDGALWFTFVVKNESSFDQRISIEMPRQYFWIAMLFVRDEQGIQKIATTGIEAIKTNEMLHTAESTFTLMIPRDKSARLLFYAESDGPIDLTTRLYSADPFLRHSFRSSNLNGVFFGILICLIIYNLYNMITSRDPTYLYFIGALSAVMMLFSTINGVGIDLFWPGAGHWNRDLLHLFAGLFVLFSLKTFLAAVDEVLPSFDRLIARWGAWIGVGLFVVPLFLPYVIPNTKGIAINITLVANVIVMSIIAILAVRSWLRGFRPALFMVIAFTPYGISTLLRTMAQFGVGFEFFLRNQPHQLAAALAMILTSMSLADRLAYVRERQNREADAMRVRNATLTEQQKILSREQEATIRVAQMLAHDVRKPFSIMRIGLDLIAGSRDHQEVQKHLANLMPEVEAASGSVDLLIRDVMEIGADTTDAGRSPTGLESLIKDTVEQAFMMLPRVKVTVDYQLHHATMAYVNRDKILRVMANIYVNALQAIGYGGHTWFMSRDVILDKKSFVELCIGNSGSFIPESNLKRIFDPFFTSGKKNGTGLGLAVARKIVEECGGQIRCASVQSDEFPLGKVEFFITLPIAAGHPDRLGLNLPGSNSNLIAPGAWSNAESELRHAADDNQGYLEAQLVQVSRKLGRKIRMLLVDDDEHYRDSLRKLLLQSQMLQAHIIISDASRAEQVLSLMEHQVFDLIICDVNLGASSLSGFELVKSIRAKLPTAMVCMHSNRIAQSDYKFAMRMGADLYMPKPMSLGQALRLTLQTSDGLLAQRNSQDHADNLSGIPVKTQEPPTLIVIDDNPFVLEAWSSKLASQAVLHLLPNFESLMERLKLQPGFLAAVTCVIIDFYIEGSTLNGLDIARMIKKMRPELIVILSSDAMVRDADIEGAVDRVIGKEPQTLDKLGLVA
ncbi:MAG: response regulator [Deltaproteobacteria bacterium]|nr:response regulator [Deltaproteobacteria bacterium]